MSIGNVTVFRNSKYDSAASGYTVMTHVKGKPAAVFRWAPTIWKVPGVLFKLLFSSEARRLREDYAKGN